MKTIGDPPWWLPPHSSARSERVRPRFAVIFGRKGRLTLIFLPGRCVCKVGGQNRLPRLKPDWPKNGSKRPSSGPRVLGNFSRVLKLKMSVLGLGFYLECKTRLIYSLGSFSGKKPRTDLDTDKILLFELLKAITFYP